MRMYQVSLIVIVSLFVAVAGACSTAAPPSQPTAAQAPSANEAPKAGAKNLDFAMIPINNPIGDSMDWFAKEVTSQSKGSLNITYHPGTLISKELEIIDAVKTGNVAIGSPAGAAQSVVPELSVFAVPYLVRDYDHAYKMFNGDIGQQLSKMIEEKYKFRVLYFTDFGFRHFFNTKRPIKTAADLNGLKMRVMGSKIYTDTVNALGGSAVPLSWGETMSGIQQGVIDGADLPVINLKFDKAYEVAKYASLSYHNYSPSFVAINPGVWNSLTPEQQKLLSDVGLQAQQRLRKVMEDADTLEGAKKLLDPLGMSVNMSDVDGLRKLAQDRVWPGYKQQYPDMWDKIINTK